MSVLKTILGFSDFLNKQSIVEFIRDEYGVQTDVNRLLLIFISPSQKTYFAKNGNEFLIINDNQGDVILASRSTNDEMQIEYIDDSEDDYKIKFSSLIDWILASKNLFLNKQELKSKIESL